MIQEIRIPDIGDAEAVEVVEICVAPGDHVTLDDVLIVIESDKASMEVPAGIDGVVEEITVAVGDEVQEGKVIARLASKAAADDAGASPTDETLSTAEREAPAASQEAPAAAEKAPAAKQAPAASEQAPAASQKETAASQKDIAAPQTETVAKAGVGRILEIRVPDIGEAQNVVVIEVTVAPGDQVTETDVLVVVESDKASMEIPANHRGAVQTVHVAEGDEVDEGTLLVTLELTEAHGHVEAQAAGEAKSSTQAVAEPAAQLAPEPSPGVTEEAEPRGQQPKATQVYAGPAVRRLARELGVQLADVNGSGSRGRIVKDDVKSFVKSRLSDAQRPAASAGALPAITLPDFSRYGEIEIVPLSRIRARGAENLHRSWVNLPHVTQHDEVDVTDLEAFRRSLKGEAESRGAKLTPLAFIIKACCHALRAFPTVNASLDMAQGAYILKRYYHIGMAVDTEEGLVVPVIRDADRKGIWELSEEVIALAEKARAQKLGMNDLQGGTFSVSSLGTIGGTGFTPIINAPEVAILGVSAMRTKPFWNGSDFEPRQMLPLSLSYDHRALNGAEAGRFVSYLGDLLRDVRRLAL